MRQVAILLFNEIEVLDFAGPFEVFGVAGRQSGQTRFSEPPFQVFTVAERGPVYARNGLSINPTYLLNDHPKPDILLVPGGGSYLSDGTPAGARREMHNPAVLNWVRRHADKAELVLSVCTGSMILAGAGLLDGLSATTHKSAIRSMADLFPAVSMQPERRWVDNGKIITSAGISAGIDMSLYVVGKLLGEEVAHETASYMQYEN
ncbi:DJ-1/PfpI family protein [Fibrivirga algicola]|uniref:DJ-1/PfpI family protein n=1 Tax=Fibrivirga algicola TaxID=2950420 RepID=A0ABX0QN30_9BACT|nr:DJ-1/PfpI family protein [Fibrivirga algicola]ARK12575.1 AraC family transcriptional regulator [Fibrella sp. ES10-3-2-2]NID12272.1 DJ-1/PfpI family protein [Fibrivirga algicola]